MYSALATLLDRLENAEVSGSKVIPWGCPVPAFGELANSHIATLGINPSNREFVDEAGVELIGAIRRFHTLKSLGIRSWADASSYHLELILSSCHSYFAGNPYDQWFRKLDFIISGTQASYYSGSRMACHLDLIPYATACKWTDLTPKERTALLGAASDVLGVLLRDSPVRVLVLNGQSVVEQFEEISGQRLKKKTMREWSLPRKTGNDVVGVAYSGKVRSIAGVNLGRDIIVLGYNHNIQSSFGVTSKVMSEIRSWLANNC